jgi:hypothetical protein
VNSPIGRVCYMLFFVFFIYWIFLYVLVKKTRRTLISKSVQRDGSELELSVMLQLRDTMPSHNQTMFFHGPVLKIKVDTRQIRAGFCCLIGDIAVVERNILLVPLRIYVYMYIVGTDIHLLSLDWAIISPIFRDRIISLLVFLALWPIKCVDTNVDYKTSRFILRGKLGVDLFKRIFPSRPTWGIQYT